MSNIFISHGSLPPIATLDIPGILQPQKTPSSPDYNEYSSLHVSRFHILIVPSRDPLTNLFSGSRNTNGCQTNPLVCPLSSAISYDVL
jgi:hypothetical protein